MRDDTLELTEGQDALDTLIADDRPRIPQELTGIVAATLPALALAACGGGGSVASPSAAAPQAPPPPPAVVLPTPVQSSRFLAQTTMGSTKADIAAVSTSGYDSWLTTQFAIARTTSHWDWLVSQGFNAAIQ